MGLLARPPRGIVNFLVYRVMHAATVHMERKTSTMMTMKSPTKEVPILIVFGKPGAGKTTITNEAFQKLGLESRICLVLDLDVCIPQWMKDNFATQIYPTLAQRHEFALTACQYVEEQIQCSRNERKEMNGDFDCGVLISFSFVNTDLRQVFREKFPHAVWALIDVSNELAQERIRQRQDHFYKVSEPKEKESQNTLESNSDGEMPKQKQSDWEFCQVDFDHILLDGKDSIQVNASKVSDTFKSLFETSRQND